MEKNQTSNSEMLTEEKMQESSHLSLTARPVAVIVGGSSGIGLEIGNTLLTKGYGVINISRTVAKNERMKNITADVTQGEELERAIQAVGLEYKNIAILFYSAGFSFAAPLEVAKETDIRYLFEVNYFGAVRAVKAALPYMKKQGGKVVFISSLGGDIPIPFESFYSSSKSALDMLAKTIRTELRPYKISVTSVQAGGTSTSFTFKRKVYSDEENGAYCKAVHKAVAALGNMEQGGMSPTAVADSVVMETLKNNPAITFVPGGKNKAYRLMGRWLPEKMSEYFNNKKYNQ